MGKNTLWWCLKRRGNDRERKRREGQSIEDRGTGVCLGRVES